MRRFSLCFILSLLLLLLRTASVLADGEAEYTILNPATGLFLTAGSPDGALSASGLHDGFAGQIFRLDGQRIILSGSSPLQALTYDDGALVLRDVSDDAAQLWEIAEAAGESLILHTGQALTAEGAELILAPCTGADSQLWSLLPYERGGDMPGPTVTISWEDMICCPSKQSAYLCVKPVASQAGRFSDFHLKVWDSEGNPIAARDEQGDDTIKLSICMWYEVYSETGVLLAPRTQYRYQFSVTFDGRPYTSPLYSFTTGDTDSRHFGIDVSSHNGTIDWETASRHIDFAILRCGYAGDYPQCDDTCWLYNVSECERLGIPYGVYLYSYAENDEEALGEAAHVIRLLDGHRPAMPVYYDLEDADTVGSLSNAQIMRQVDLFSNAIIRAGYQPGVYANVNWRRNRLDASAMAEQSQWLAAWSGAYAGMARDYDLWQFSNAGRVPGVKTRVDLDYCDLFYFSEPEQPVYIPLEPDLVLPSSLQIIGSEAFAACRASAVRIPSGALQIASRAFASCASLRQIEIPASVQQISEDAFEGCRELVIIGSPGSAAEAFCARCGYQWFTP